MIPACATIAEQGGLKLIGGPGHDVLLYADEEMLLRIPLLTREDIDPLRYAPLAAVKCLLSTMRPAPALDLNAKNELRQDSARYLPIQDRIEIFQYDNSDEVVSELVLHESIHSTAHWQRVSRFRPPKNQGDLPYTPAPVFEALSAVQRAEEVVAGLGASLLAYSLRIAPCGAAHPLFWFGFAASLDPIALRWAVYLAQEAAHFINPSVLDNTPAIFKEMLQGARASFDVSNDPQLPA